MTTDLVHVDYAAELERVADPAEFVVATLERAKSWLSAALDDGDIERIVELKSQGEAIRVYTMSKQLGKDTQLAATEIVRRAERGIGVAIRKGQESGEVASRAEIWSEAAKGRHLDQQDENLLIKRKPRATDFVSSSDLTGNGAGILHLTDHVTDEAFEAAISEARAEGNMSRANLVRKVQKEEQPVSPPVRTQVINLPAQRRALEGASLTLSGIAMGLRQIDEIHPAITSEEAAEWVDGLSEARREIERVIKRLKERVNSVPQA